MQSAKTIFGTSIIILLLFSFPRSHGFRNNFCSRDSQLNSNCQEQRVNIYHQFEKHLNGKAVRNNVDLRRERLLQIRAVGNDRERDLSTRSVNSERSYSQITPESIIDRQNRKIILPVRDFRVFEQSDRFRDTHNRVKVPERYKIERETRVIDHNRKTNIRNIDRVQNRKHSLSDHEIRVSERRNIQPSDHNRENNIRNIKRDAPDRLNIRERFSLNLESNFTNRKVSPQTQISRERPQIRNILSLERKTRSTEIRNSEIDVQNSRTSKRVRENTDRVREIRDQVQVREKLLPQKESHSERDVRDSRTSERDRENTNRIRESRDQLQVRERLSSELKSRSVVRKISERDIRDLRKFERVRENTDRVQESRERQVRKRLSSERKSRSVERRITERDVRDSRISERVRENNDRVAESSNQLQVREKLSPERESHSVDSKISERDIRDLRTFAQVNKNTNNVRESRNRLQTRERLSPERESRSVERKISKKDVQESGFIERRMSERDDRDSRKSERVRDTIYRVRESREQLQVREKLSPQRESRSVERRITEIDVRDSRTSERVRENTDRIREYQNQLQVKEKESRSVKRGISERNDRDSRITERDDRDSRISERIRKNTDRVRESRNRLQVREKLSPERESRSVERSISERDVKDSRTSERIRENTDRVAVPRNRLQVREKLSPERESRSVERKRSERDVQDLRTSARVSKHTNRVGESRNRLQIREKLFPERKSRSVERRLSEREVRHSSISERVRDTDSVRKYRERETSFERKTINRPINTRDFRITETEKKTSDRRISKRNTWLSENNRNINNLHESQKYRERINIERREVFREREARLPERRSHEHIRVGVAETREQHSLERDARLSERQNNREIRSLSFNNVRISDHRKERNTRTAYPVNIRERTSEHTRKVQQISPEVNSRISDLRTDGSNFIRREVRYITTGNTIGLNERIRKSKERQIHNADRRSRKNSIQCEPQSVDRRLSERISKSREFLQGNERSSELHNGNTNNLESRFRTFDNLRSTEHRQSREQLKHERLDAERQNRLFERRSTERVFNTREIRSISRNLQQIQEQFSTDRNPRLFQNIDRRMNTIDSTDSNQVYGDQTTFIRNIERREQKIQDVRISERPTRKTRLEEISTERHVSNKRRDIRYSHTLPSQDQRITERRTITKETERENHHKRISDEQKYISTFQNIRNNRIRETRDSRLFPEQNNRIADRRNEIRDSRMSIRSITVPEESRIRSVINLNSRTVERSISRERLVNRSVPTQYRRINNEKTNIRKNQLSERQEIHSVNNRENVVRDLKQHLKNVDNRRLFTKDNNRSTSKRHNERLSRLSKNSERLIDNNRRINIKRNQVFDQERLENIQKVSDRRLNERQMNILSREQKEGFHFAPDQRDMSVFRVAYPTNKVQDFSVEFVENIWINVVKILLTSLLLLQISRSKTADLNMFKCVKVPMFSQLFKEKVQ